MEHVMRILNGIVHYSTVDAVFRDEEGKSVMMEFHHFCGPHFYYDEMDGGHCPEDFVWNQFNGWWEAKGKAIYHKKFD